MKCSISYFDRFTIYMRRKPLYYVMNIMLPCLMLSLLDLLVFCLPPESGEKVSLGITVLLSFSVFLLVIADNVPQTSETAPLLGETIKDILCVWIRPPKSDLKGSCSQEDFPFHSDCCSLSRIFWMILKRPILQYKGPISVSVIKICPNKEPFLVWCICGTNVAITKLGNSIALREHEIYKGIWKLTF